jgi:DNA-binding transcriptional ArsR family regulator
VGGDGTSRSSHRPHSTAQGCSAALDIAYSVSVSLPLVTTYEQAALEALGDPTRREIFERLSRSPLAVGELAGELPVSRPAVSQHLKVLKNAGLVFDRPAGTRRVYQVDPRAVEALREYFDAFWGQALQNFQRAAEAPTDQSKESR